MERHMSGKISREPTGEQSGWDRVYLIAAVLGITGTGGAAIARVLYTFGSSLKTTVTVLSVALLVSILAILYMVTEQS